MHCLTVERNPKRCKLCTCWRKASLYNWRLWRPYQRTISFTFLQTNLQMRSLAPKWSLFCAPLINSRYWTVTWAAKELSLECSVIKSPAWLLLCEQLYAASHKGQFYEKFCLGWSLHEEEPHFYLCDRQHWSKVVFSPPKSKQCGRDTDSKSRLSFHEAESTAGEIHGSESE